MLEDDYAEQLSKLLAQLPSEVQAPEALTETRHGERSSRPVPDDRRRFQRVTLRGEAVCELLSGLPAITRDRKFLKVLINDVSRAGMSFTTAIQLYPGEGIVLWTQGRKLRCQVARCKMHNDRCFEVGAFFQG